MTSVTRENDWSQGFLKYMTNGYHLSGTITYSFLSSPTLASEVTIFGVTGGQITDFFNVFGIVEDPAPTFLNLEGYEALHANFIQSTKILSTYANLNFEEVDQGGYLSIFKVQNLKLTQENGSLYEPEGLGSYVADGNTGAAIFLKDLSGYAYDVPLDAADYKQWVGLHELLHSLGLYHPHDGGGGTFVLNGELAATRFTVMSYNHLFSNLTVDQAFGGFPVTPMPLDIAALQFLYGERSANEGNTSYFGISDGDQIDVDGGDGRVAIGRALYCIWDTQGVDTIDFSAASSDVLINLNQAQLNIMPTLDILQIRQDITSSDRWASLPEYIKVELLSDAANAGGNISSSFSRLQPGSVGGGFVIAADPSNGAQDRHVERAVGGAGEDVLVGNRYANFILGLFGNDLIVSGEGADIVEGGGGNDEIVGGSGADELNGNDGDDVIDGGADADAINGGTNTAIGDTVSYARSHLKL